ncbi:Melanocortin-2 Receptor Accessory Protein [Manis pentadactyla]|nr:Melanocortin-2 Receptor Accessory Protein [Manis pentadactyla]
MAHRPNASALDYSYEYYLDYLDLLPVDEKKLKANKRTMSSTNECAPGAPASTVPSASGGTYRAQGTSGTRRAPPSSEEEPDSRAPGPEQQLQPGAPPPLPPLPPARGCSPWELALDGDPRASADFRNKPRERPPEDRTSLHCRTNTSKLWPLLSEPVNEDPPGHTRVF